MDPAVQTLQNNLVKAGNTLTVDGVLGPVTLAAVLNYVADRQLGAIASALAGPMLINFPKYDIDLTRMAHFIGQGCEETEAFRFFTELGGPTYFARYENDKDLGNTQPGDGYRFRGRGIFQITGRYNYADYGAKLGIGLVDNPDTAAYPGTAVMTACLFWQERNLNPLADADNITEITRKINGGENGLQNRTMYTQRFQKLLSA